MLFNLSMQDLSIMVKAIDYYVSLNLEGQRNPNLIFFKDCLLKGCNVLPINEQDLYQEDIPEILKSLWRLDKSKATKELLQRYLLALKHWRLSECPSR